MSLDSIAIPKDAPHVAAAYAFIDLLLRPEDRGKKHQCDPFRQWRASPRKPYVSPDVLNSKAIYPDDRRRCSGCSPSRAMIGRVQKYRDQRMDAGEDEEVTSFGTFSRKRDQGHAPHRNRNGTKSLRSGSTTSGRSIGGAARCRQSNRSQSRQLTPICVTGPLRRSSPSA